MYDIMNTFIVVNTSYFIGIYTIILLSYAVPALNRTLVKLKNSHSFSCMENDECGYSILNLTQRM